MKIIKVNNVESFAKKTQLTQSIQNKKIVESILFQIQKNGDVALRRYEKKFTGVTLKSLRVTKKEIQFAYSQVSKIEIQAINLAKSRLRKTENTVKKQLKNITTNENGVKILKSYIPIKSVGCYVPGGLARYPSSAIMSIVPAKVAGVPRIVVVSPPNEEGKIDPLTLVAADICGANEIFKIGGAQAIGALSFGTKSVMSVDKIVGPGGQFVTIAKSIVSNRTSIDMLAGPTELCIIIDDTVNPELIVDDLISQAEHSNDTLCYVITTSSSIAKKINKIIEKKIKKTPRSKIIEKSLKNNGFIAICKNSQNVIKLTNSLAPEHLEIITKNSKRLIEKITTPGLILVGKNSPSSASDYLLGSNHILPTNGFGKTRGALSVLDFLKLNTKIETSKKALQKISKYLDAITTAEGLPNHYNAVRNRLK